MTHTQNLESITRELQNFSRSYINQNEVCLAKEIEDTVNAINHLISVYNYGYEGNALDILNKHVAQKISSLQRVIKVKSSNQKEDITNYVLSSLYNYSTVTKVKQ